MSDGKQNVNGMSAGASWEVSASQACGFPDSNANTAQPEPCPRPTNPCLAPLLSTPADVSAGQAGRADQLRRALTSPWRLLTPRRAAPARGGTERSCHAFAGSTAPLNAAPGGDISAPGRIDRRSTASAASQRSLFTIDGLPEPLAPDPSILHEPLPPWSASGSNGLDGSSSGQQRPAARPLQHAATALDTVATSGTGEPCGPLPHPFHLYGKHTQTQIPIQTGQGQTQERSWHRLAGRGGGSAGPSAPYISPYSCDAAVDGLYRPESGPGGGEQRSPHPYTQHPYVQPYPSLDQRQQQPAPAMQQPPLLGSSVASGGTSLLGPMHHLLQQPGGADAFVHSGHEPVGRAAAAATRSTEPPLSSQPPLDPSAAAAALAGVSGADAASAGAAAADGAVPSSGQQRQQQLHCDDARNPMSPNYDPSVKPDIQRHNPPKYQTALPQDGSASWKGSAGGGSVRPAAGTAIGNGDAARGGLADASAGNRDGYGAEVVSSNGPFVVLEMKGPRGTPSTHAAAAAAFLSGASASPAAPEAAAAAAGVPLTLRGRVSSYFAKWYGVGDTLMPADQPVDVFWSWLGSFLSITVVAVLNQFLTPHVSLPLMIASFGASAVLLFGVPASKLAQPRNFLGGQVVSAIVGVCVRLVFTHAPHLVWLSASLGMSLSLVAMQLTRTVHPPGGASALIASSAAYIGPWYGFKFVLTVLFGSLAMLVVAVGINNLSSRRRYPTYWLGK